MESLDKQWILSSWDSWERNPYYVGPEQPHPESNYPDDEPQQLPPPPAEIYLDNENNYPF
jgi:hypothetical protein